MNAQRWEILRAQLLDSLEQVLQGLRFCKSEDDFLLVLDLLEPHAELARRDLKTGGTSNPRMEAMRAAVKAMRGALEPIDPLKKK